MVIEIRDYTDEATRGTCIRISSIEFNHEVTECLFLSTISGKIIEDALKYFVGRLRDSLPISQKYSSVIDLNAPDLQ